MGSDRFLPDRILTGILLGVPVILLTFMFSGWVLGYLGDVSGRDDLSLPPRPQLLVLVMTLVLFRILVVNFDKEKTGKGFLMVMFVAFLSYTYYSFRIRHAY